MQATTRYHEPDARLARIVCEVWTARMGRMLRTFLVNHNERDGRAQTAIAARQAMLDGHVFVSYPAASPDPKQGAV